MNTIASTPSDNADREQRKAIRRSRVSTNENVDGQNGESSSSASKQESEYTGERRIAKSHRRLDEIQARSTDIVTESRIKAEQEEKTRRDVDDAEHRRRAEFLQGQYVYLQDDGRIASGWETCSSAKNAQDLCNLLKEQKDRCDEVIRKLEAISNELGAQLRQKDHEFVIALKRNRLEIESLQENITREHLIIKEAFERELNLIDESFDADRKQITNKRKEELDALIVERSKVETERLERQQQIIDDQRKQIKDSESKGELDNRALKETLESELKRLEIELENTRARHQFDADKLEYDVRVLTELSENESAVKKQKRRIMKGKEELNREIETKEKEKARGMRVNEVLEDDCERIERQSSGLKEKFERFKVSDDEKYKAILALHRDDLRQLEKELKESQEFIFGGAIGCCNDLYDRATDASCVSDLTFPDDMKSCVAERRNKADEWNQAEILITDYRNVLEKREGLNAEVKSIENQNEKLEKELQLKLKEKINEELAFPPSQLISFDSIPSWQR